MHARISAARPLVSRFHGKFSKHSKAALYHYHFALKQYSMRTNMSVGWWTARLLISNKTFRIQQLTLLFRSPNAAQANATTECAASCPQGNGTAGETEQYASCQSSCISSLFFATATSGATYNSAATNAAGSTTGGIVAASTSGASGSLNSGSATASATGSSATSTGGASNLQLGVTGAGILGLVVMGFAL